MPYSELHQKQPLMILKPHIAGPLAGSIQMQIRIPEPQHSSAILRRHMKSWGTLHPGTSMTPKWSSKGCPSPTITCA